MWTDVCHRLVGVGDGEDLGPDRNPAAVQTVRITTSVEALVVRADCGACLFAEAERRQQPLPDGRMAAQGAALRLPELLRASERFPVEEQLADVVQPGDVFQLDDLRSSEAHPLGDGAGEVTDATGVSLAPGLDFDHADEVLENRPRTVLYLGANAFDLDARFRGGYALGAVESAERLVGRAHRLLDNGANVSSLFVIPNPGPHDANARARDLRE